MSSSPSPRVVIFAGPNGAGKTTHAEAILDALDIGIFVNADYIARGLSGPRAATVAIEAGRIMLKRLRQLADGAEDFAFESTLSSRSCAAVLRDLKTQGYRVVDLLLQPVIGIARRTKGAATRMCRSPMNGACSTIQSGDARNAWRATLPTACP